MIVGARNRRIDLIRGVAILLVLFHHFNIAYRLDLGGAVVQAIARNGNHGVTIFFVVSGYLITSHADRRWDGLAAIDARSFYGFRVARILPCLILLLAVVNLLALAGVALFQNRAEGHAPSFWLVNVASLTFWMNVLVGREGWVNYPLGVLWSLSVEEVFYLSFPLLCRWLRDERRLLTLWSAFIVVGPVWRLAHRGDEGGYLYAYLACFDGIAVGCCTAVLAKVVQLRGWMARSLPVGAALGMVCLYLCAPISRTNALGVTAMALGTAVLLLHAHDRPTGPVLERSHTFAALGWCGRLSYELYLFHLMVLALLRTAFPPRGMTGNTAVLLLVAAFVVVSAALSWTVSRFYAEPLNRSLRLVTSRTSNVAGRDA